MPLIKCVDCGKDVSTSATSCPSCGCPVTLQAPPPPPPPSTVSHPPPPVRTAPPPPVPPVAPTGLLVTGWKLRLSGAVIGFGFLLTLFGANALGFLVMWVGVAGALHFKRWMWVLAFFVAMLLAIPGGRLEQYRKAKQEAVRAEEAAKQHAAARRADEVRRAGAAEAARKAAEVAADAFPQERAQLLESISAAESLLRKRDYRAARGAVAALKPRVTLLLRSRLSGDAGVVALSQRVAAIETELARVQATANEAAKARQEQKAKREREVASANAITDLEIVSSSWHKGGFDTIALWKVRIRNKSKLVAYRDMVYKTSYSAASGTEVGESAGKILEIIRPGQVRTFEVNDGFVHSQATRGGFSLIGGEKVIE